MPQVINTNIASLNAQRNLNKSQGMLATSLQRLSSGMRINSAKDDAAGLAISERFTAQIKGLNQAVRNSNDGISLAQTAEGALGEVTNNLQRIRELAVQSANATNSSSDRAAMQQEVSQLIAEIDRVATQTNFNDVKLLDGSFASQTFQVGANVGETISVASIVDSTKSGLGLGSDDATLTTGGLAVSGALTTGELIVNGTEITGAQDAAVIGGLISGISGVTATVGASSVSSGAYTASTTSGSFSGAEVITITLNDGSSDTDITITAGSTGAVSASEVGTQLGAGSLATTLASAGYTISGVNGTTGDATFSRDDGKTVTVTKTTATAAGGNSDGAIANEGGVGYGSIDSITSVGADLVITGTAAGDAGLVAGTTSGQLGVTTVADANTLITAVDAALNTVNSSRATLGAIQNRFESVVTSLQTSSESLSAARSRIQDTDFASETANLTKAQILQQAGMAMMAQANSLPQNVLSLLQ